MTIIHTATDNELEVIQSLDRLALGSDSRKSFLAKSVSAGRCLIATVNDKVVGFGILEQTFYSQGFIGLLIVHPDYRRRSIATSLIHRMESICPTVKLFTSTNKSNIPAQKTYEANGFVKSGYIENLDDGDPEIIYFKRLKDTNAVGVT